MEQIANALKERILVLISMEDISATKICSLINTYIKVKENIWKQTKKN